MVAGFGSAPSEPDSRVKHMDLTTRYMGLQLKNPLVASASPLNADLSNIRRLEDAGAAAVVLPSLFEEQIEAEGRRYDRLTSSSAESFPEALTYFPQTSDYRVGPQQYLDLVKSIYEPAGQATTARSSWAEHLQSRDFWPQKPPDVHASYFSRKQRAHCGPVATRPLTEAVFAPERWPWPLFCFASEIESA
jgi:hypothetical protein